MRIKAFEMWCWRRVLRIPWTDKVSNEDVLRREGETYRLHEVIEERKNRLVGHLMRHSI